MPPALSPECLLVPGPWRAWVRANVHGRGLVGADLGVPAEDGQAHEQETREDGDALVVGGQPTGQALLHGSGQQWQHHQGPTEPEAEEEEVILKIPQNNQKVMFVIINPLIFNIMHQ